MIKILFLLLTPYFLFANEYKVASYNIENLFDVSKSGHEYREYIPNTKSGWNNKMLSIKIKNIAKVIKEIDADIIALQEVENIKVLKRLNLALGMKKYPYMYSDFKSFGVDSVLLSRFPIKSYKSYILSKKSRPIHKIVVDVKGLHVSLFLNHWPSYKHGVKKRLEHAKALKKLYEKEQNYMLLGDFNSPLHVDKKGWGKSVNYVGKNNYNLWYELIPKKRYSYAFFKRRNALDHIIISKDIFYKEGSFGVYKPKYLRDKYKNPKRWQITKRGKGKHLGFGYSDHFAIVATFSTKKQKVFKPKKTTISKLLKNENTKVNYLLNDVMVIDKSKYGVVVEDKNRDTIYIYKPDCKLEVANVYNLHVREIAEYKGKKEIVLLDFNYCLDKIND